MYDEKQFEYERETFLPLKNKIHLNVKAFIKYIIYGIPEDVTLGVIGEKAFAWD